MIIGVYELLSNVNKSSVNVFITTMNRCEVLFLSCFLPTLQNLFSDEWVYRIIMQKRELSKMGKEIATYTYTYITAT
jgi:hypothetical protein